MADPEHPPTPAGAAPAAALLGRVVAGRYRIERVIGRGGMGVVYQAVHVGLDKPVAIKLIADKYSGDQEALVRFRREARAASRIGHEGIVDVTDVDETDDGRPFIVMELLEGADLADVSSRTGPMPAPRALHICRQILAALGAAHERGIVHRDMKPENVFLARRRGRDDVVKIMDFGISKFLVAIDSKLRLTETGAIMGTPVYMAPEQAQASPQLDHRVDIYAVGVMLYEMLAGRPPFTAPSYLALVTQHLHDEPPPLPSFRPDLPPQLSAAVHRALAKDPAERYRNCAAFAAALPEADELAELMSRGVTVAGEGEAFAPARRAGARRRAWPWALAAALLVAGGGAALMLKPGSGERGAPAAAASASLEVASMPAAAAVYLDGERVGTTPLRLDSVPAGEHQIRLEKAGYATLVAAKTVRAGYRESFAGALSPAAELSAPAATADAGSLESSATTLVRGAPGGRGGAGGSRRAPRPRSAEAGGTARHSPEPGAARAGTAPAPGEPRAGTAPAPGEPGATRGGAASAPRQPSATRAGTAPAPREPRAARRDEPDPDRPAPAAPAPGDQDRDAAPVRKPNPYLR